VVYVTRKGLIDNNFTQAADEAFDVLCAYIKKHHLMGAIQTWLGITPDEESMVGPENARYMAGAILARGKKIEREGEIDVQVIPAGRWVVFIHKGPYETMWQTWQAAYRDWLPFSREEARDAPPYKAYLRDKHRYERKT
jgi:AraC family transcriptional regulator